MKRIILAITILTVSFQMSFAQFGILDPSFGNSSVPGIDTFSAIAVSGFPQAIAFQPDGRILVSTLGGTFGLGRLNTTGAPDNSFGNAGWVNVGLFDMSDIAVLSDSKILTTGSPTNISYNDTYVWKYKADGTLDSTFGYNGRVGDSTMGPGNARVAIQSGTKIICSGDRGVKRLDLANGSLDMSFGTNGFIRVPQLPLFIYSMTVDSATGNILLAGLTLGNHIAIARLTANGVLDATFGTNGVDSLSILATGLGIGMKVRINSAGKIILASDCDKTYGYNQVICAQFNADGSPDNGFGTNGISYPDWKTIGGNTEYFGGMALQSDDRIMIASMLRDSGVSTSVNSAALVRLHTDGSSDTVYGVPKFDFHSNGAWPGAIGIGPDGKVVLNGMTGGYELIARYGIGYPSGINENSAQISALTLYPNPTHGNAILSFTVKENTEVSATIYSVDGRAVGHLYNGEMFQAGKYTKEIPLNNIAPGSYHIVVSDKSGSQHISFEKL